MGISVTAYSLAKHTTTLLSISARLRKKNNFHLTLLTYLQGFAIILVVHNLSTQLILFVEKAAPTS